MAEFRITVVFEGGDRERRWVRYDDLVTYLRSYDMVEPSDGLEFLRQDVDQAHFIIETDDPDELLACLASQGYRVTMILNIADHEIIPLKQEGKECTKKKR